ncbi:phosphatase PAP2 family protein [Gottfriedia luciferensis]|uniref:phosphatase PAP2 family protein n=1 Tax=Gottfriedia luciferensis TaxID=178774 RepID=UPI000B43CF07|nr:phosphatase PAP2 family protein [Gottfriedia luciferensis]
MKKNNWILIFTSVFLFVILGLIYDSKLIHRLDQSAFKFFEAIRTNGLDSFCYFLRDFGSSKIYLTFSIIMLIYSILRKRLWSGISLVITLLTGRVIVTILKDFYERPRPASMYYFESGFSFPSGHAVMASTFFLTLSFILFVIEPKLMKHKKLIHFLAFFMIFLISMSRIYLHVHHFSDIIAGWLIGFAWYSLCKNVFISLHEKGQLT